MTARMFAAQWKAESLRILRSPFFVLFSLAMPVTFYFLFAGINGVEKPIGDTTWGVYSLMSMTAFSLIGTAVSQFGIRLAYERKQGWLRQLRLSPIHPLTWMGAKLVSQLLVHLLIIVLLFPLAATVNSLELSAGQWVACAVWLWLGSVPFLAVGAWIGTFRNADAATALSNMVLMGMAVAGGLWMPMEVLPGWMQAIGKWLPSYHYASGAWSLLENRGIYWGNTIYLVTCTLLFVLLSGYLMAKREEVR